MDKRQEAFLNEFVSELKRRAVEQALIIEDHDPELAFQGQYWVNGLARQPGYGKMSDIYMTI